MVHTSVQVNGQEVTNPKAVVAIKLFLGTVMFGVGALLMYLHYATVSGIYDALDWVAAPCVIEQSEFLTDDKGVRYLEVVYRYEYEGQSYRSDRLDLLPGHMGDDDSWEEQLHQKNPAGSEAVCFVDPGDPEQAVLDREHGRSGAGNLRLLGFPFLFVGCAFYFSEISRRMTSPSPVTDIDEAGSESLDLPSPPRRVGLGKTLAFALGAPVVGQLAWAFLVGFLFVFRILEGPAMLLDLVPSDTIQVEGEITRVAGLETYEFEQQVYGYEFQFESNGEMYTGESYERGSNHRVGDRVAIVVDPENPDSAHIAGSRQREVPLWVALIFGAPVPLLAFGIVAGYVFNFRSVALLRNGVLTTAVREDGPSPLGEGDENAPYANLPKFVFDAGGVTHRVDPRSHVPASEDEVTVLYNPRNPKRNIGLNPQQTSILRGAKNAWYSVGAALIVPGVCLAAVCWLLGWA